ncbi:MAG: hypothetical protein QNL05_10955 [Gammaproteobacteria bacterium]|nr:hypothetical protein [Gammaproteobacteria bacterium]
MTEPATATRESAATTSPAEPASDTAPTTEGGVAAVGNAAFARAIENGGFLIPLGRGLELSAEDIGPGRGRATVNLGERSQILPGVHMRTLSYDRRNSTARVTGDVTVPYLRTPRGGLRLNINNQGQASLDATLTSDLPIFKNKTLQVGLDEQSNLSATLTIEPGDLKPSRGAPNLSVTGGGSFTLERGKLTGNIEADLAYTQLGSGHFTFAFNGEGRASGSGNFDFEQDYLNGASASLDVDEEANLKAEIGIPVSEIQTPISGLSITEGTVRFTMDNSTPGGGLEAVKFVYGGIGEAVITANIRNGQFNGGGTFGVTLSELTEVNGRFTFRSGVLSGNVQINSRNFPRALRVQSGTITGTLQESGDVDFSGQAIINLGPAGTGELRASKENGVVTIGATIILENIPGLQSGQFTVDFTSEGNVAGEGELQTDDSYIPGLTGRVLVRYGDNLWFGETQIDYSREDPNLSGSILVRVRQTEAGTLVISGEGELTAGLFEGVEGTAGVIIDEEGNVIVNFAITQTNPYELFAERRQEREFLNISQNIPLFAGIVVAVIRIRAGARAGVGPGQIRNSVITGTWEVTSEEPPALNVSSEFYMPAFVEGYVAFGAGLGVDVLLGSLTGGIEAMATAGLYGAISVVPELSYQDGDWMFEGTATLAAGARLKLSLNAWAEIEALWVTVWDRTWELASHTMNIGPDLVLSANVAMNLSNPSIPELTFDSSDTDNRGLIDGAMPEDGPPAAGTREAIENRAEWAGRSAPGPEADSVPSDLTSQANESADAPAAPARPPRRDGPPAGATPEGANAAPGATPAAPATAGSATGAAADTNAAATNPATPQGAVPESEVLGADQPRFSNPISLDTLNEPPVPMPRTAEQQVQDLDAAARVFELVEAQVEDTEQLAEYFPRIRTRFNLTSIGFETVGDETQVSLQINPGVKKVSSELVKGRGIAGKVSKITYSSGTISGSSDTVGLEMVADPLGPDHPAGSGASGQSDLMGRLETSQSNTEDKKFIRGHLLNDNVGGPGSAENQFPITAAANRAHEQQIEDRVKTWVNEDRYWVYYKVRVAVSEVDISDASKYRKNKVTARFFCEAAVYNLRNQKRNAIRATIVSHYNPPADTEVVVNPRGPDRDSETAVSVRQADLDAHIDESTRHRDRDYRLNLQVYSAIARSRRRMSFGDIHTALIGTGIGDARVLTLEKAYEASKGSGGNMPEISNILSAAERPHLTYINTKSADIVAALQS